MKIKLASTMSASGHEALDVHAGALYSTLGTRRVIIAELCAIERTQVAADEEKQVVVTLQIKELEVAGEAQEDAVRRAMEALHIQRTAYGTLTEDNDVELSDRTLENCAGDLTVTEAARLHVVVEKWGEKARQASRSSKTNAADLRRELTDIAEGLRIALYPDALVTT